MWNISCSVFSQEFGLARFKSNQVKAMKGLEYALSNLQGMSRIAVCVSRIHEKWQTGAKEKQKSHQIGKIQTYKSILIYSDLSFCLINGPKQKEVNIDVMGD